MPSGKKAAKKFANKKATKRTTAKKSARAAKLFFSSLGLDGFRAVCDSHDFVGPVHQERLDATKDANVHAEATGHQVRVIRTQSKET